MGLSTIRPYLLALAFALAALALWTGGQRAAAGPLTSQGDVDCNGRVDSRDAALVLQHSAGLLASLPCALNAYADGIPAVTSIDATLILQRAAGLVSDLPPRLDYVGTVVVVRGVEADCLAVDTGTAQLVIWDPTGLVAGQRVSILGFIDPFATFCGISPLLRNLSISVLGDAP